MDILLVFIFTLVFGVVWVFVTGIVGIITKWSLFSSLLMGAIIMGILIKVLSN